MSDYDPNEYFSRAESETPERTIVFLRRRLADLGTQLEKVKQENDDILRQVRLVIEAIQQLRVRVERGD